MGESKIETIENWIDYFDEFNNESPRGAVIIAAAFLDAQLQKLIENHFINDKLANQEIFDKNGSLSSFYAKIQIAYCLGLISKEIRHDLNMIRKIRNNFAHEMFELSFEDKGIIDLCNKLNTGKIPLDHITKTPENTFRVSTAILISNLGIKVEESTNKS